MIRKKSRKKSGERGGCSRRHGGFTLVELMIVVVIIGVIAAIAYPSYQKYMRESRRSDAHAGLTALAAQMERYFSDNNQYTGDLTKMGYTAANDVPTPESYYYMRVNAAANTYTLTAKACTAADVPAKCAKTPQSSDTGCLNIVLSSAGAKTPSNCWGR